MLMKSYTTYTKQQDYLLAGLIPNFLLTAEKHQESNDFDINQFIKDVEYAYGFPTTELGGTVTNTVYRYPSDPDLYPLFTYEFDDPSVVVHQYQYGIVAFIHTKDGNQTQYITRMD